MAPQLNMNAPSGEQPAFGGGMAPPPAGSDSGGLFGLAARTPKFEPELASQSQSLFMPKRKATEAPAEAEAPEQAPEQQAAQEQQAPEAPAARDGIQRPAAGLPTLPPAHERPTEAPEPEQHMPGAAPLPPLPPRQQPGQAMPGQPMPERPAPGQAMPGQPMPGQPMPERPAPGQAMPGQPMPGQQTPDRQMPGQPMPQRPAAAYDANAEQQGFVDSAPQADGSSSQSSSQPSAQSTHESLPTVERPQSAREQAPARPDETQVAMSPRFDSGDGPSEGTQPRDEINQFAPPQQQFGAPAPEAQGANPYDRGQQNQGYGDPAYAPLAPNLEPDQGQQSQWSQPHDQQHNQAYDQPYGQPYDQGYGQQQSGSHDPFGQGFGDPYAQDVYSDPTLVGQPPVPGSGPSTPAPPPMAPQGYDPYGNAYDARYEPPRRDNGGKSLGGLDLKRWGLIVLAIAVVVAIIAFIIGLLNSNDDASAETGSGQGASATAAGSGGGAEAQAKKLDALMKTSSKDKEAIGAAQVDLKSCKNIDDAIATFEDAAASRKKLAAKVAKVDTGALPGSQKVAKNLESAWMTAQNADLAFAAWGEKRKVNDAGECVGGKGKLEKATTLSLASHDPKKAAAKAWGPIAEEYGLDTVEWKKL